MEITIRADFAYMTTSNTGCEERMTNHEADRAALDRLERQHVEAWGRDGVAFAETFTEDADFVDVMGGHFHGRAVIEAMLTQGFATFMAGTELSAPAERTVEFITPRRSDHHDQWKLCATRR